MTVPTTEPERQLWLIEKGVANAVTLGATVEQVQAAVAAGVEEGERLIVVMAEAAKWRNQAA